MIISDPCNVKGKPTFYELKYLAKPHSIRGIISTVCETSLDLETLEIRLGPMAGM
jgi:hypothetical protein